MILLPHAMTLRKGTRKQPKACTTGILAIGLPPHLLIESAARAPLQRFLDRWLPLVEPLPGPTGLRWSIDVDPLEVD